MLVLPFTVAVDTREQRPYDFAAVPPRRAAEVGRRRVVEVAVKGLPTGDYSIIGHEDAVAVERKSLADLYGTIGHGYRRFAREHERMAEMRHAAVVVESTLAQMCRPWDYEPLWQSRVDPRAVYGAFLAFASRYPSVKWIFAGDRRRGQMVTLHLLESFYDEITKEA